MSVSLLWGGPVQHTCGQGCLDHLSGGVLFYTVGRGARAGAHDLADLGAHVVYGSVLVDGDAGGEAISYQLVVERSTLHFAVVVRAV